MKYKRIVVGISGATGAIYGIRILEFLKDIPDIETHLILTNPAVQTFRYETDWLLEDVKALADVCHSNRDIGSALASGSFLTEGMVIAPCSMNSLASIAHGISDTLLTRAADVILKERRRLVLMVRENPLHQGHLENMLKVTQMGGIVAPPSPAFYHRPQSIAEMVDQIVGRSLDLLNIEHDLAPRWKDSTEPS